MKKWERARRELCKGLGVGMGCLPLLRASEVWGAAQPKRLIISMSTNGWRQPAWKPHGGVADDPDPARYLQPAGAAQGQGHLPARHVPAGLRRRRPRQLRQLPGLGPQRQQGRIPGPVHRDHRSDRRAAAGDVRRPVPGVAAPGPADRGRQRRHLPVPAHVLEGPQHTHHARGGHLQGLRRRVRRRAARRRPTTAASAA